MAHLVVKNQIFIPISDIHNLKSGTYCPNDNTADWIIYFRNTER